MNNKLKYKKRIFPNGLRVVNILGFASGAVTISAYIKAGIKYDYKSKNGISHFAEHIASNNTKSFPSALEVARAIEGNGGRYSAFTWIESQEHTVHIPESSFEIGVKYIFESVFNPLITEDGLRIEKGVIKEEILRNKADSTKAVWDYGWFPLFFQNTKLARPYSGTEKDIAGIKKKDLQEFFLDYFIPQNTVLFIAGDIENTRVFNAINALNKNYKNKVMNNEDNKIILKHKNKTLIESMDYIQASFMIGIETVNIKSADKYIFDLIRVMLAGYFGAELIQKLRNEGGLIYSWASFHHALVDTGFLSINLTTSIENSRKLLNIIYDEFKRYENGNISEDEFEMAKRYLCGSLITSLQTGKDYIEWYSLQELLTPDCVINPDEAIRKYNNIKIEDVKRVTKKYFNKNKILISGIGDSTLANKLKED